MKSQTLKDKVKTKIIRSKREVFLRADFEKIGGYDQVGRALLTLESEGDLIKIGYGLYAKARLNRLTNTPMLSAVGGFEQVAQEALKRLGVNWTTSTAVKDYQLGSTQIPANSQVVILDRFKRRIATDKFELRYTNT